jgi:hypothetical protein
MSATGMNAASNLEVLMGGHRAPAWVLGLLGSLCTLLGGLVTLLIVPGLGVILIGLGGIASVVCFVVWKRISGKRVWLTDTAEGFRLRTAEGTKSYRDDQVMRMNVVRKPVYSAGLLKSNHYLLTLHVLDEPKPIELDHVVLVNESSAAATWINRTIEQYRAIAGDALEAGATVVGKGWSLTNDAIVTSNPSSRTPLPELTHLDIVDEALCVWKKGEDNPILTTPQHSENAYLLQLLLAPKIAANAEKQPPQGVSEPGLGRLIFSRKVRPLWRNSSIVCAVGAGIGAIVAAIASFAEREMAVVCLVLVGVSIAAGLVAWHTIRFEFCCHERGVMRRSLLGPKTLRYEDVGSFKFSAIRMFHNGIYAGTNLVILLTPNRPGLPIIRYGRTIQTVDDSLDNLRDSIARILANKMLASLRSEPWVPWTSSLQLGTEGIRYRPTAMFGKKDWVLLPWNEVSGFDLREGALHFWRQGTEKSVIQQPCADDNFYPGYFALLQWMSAVGSSEPMANEAGSN